MILSGTGVQWWCSASGARWTWTWRAYPGIWAIVALTGWWMVRHARPAGKAPRWRRIALFAGVFVLWATLDWPAGPLGTGYLASVHAVQYVSLSLVVSPLLLIGIDRDSLRAKRSGFLVSRLRRVGGALTQPVLAASIFTIVMSVTHMPPVVDTLMSKQWGSFILDMLWFASGILLWWPVIVRVPERAWFVPPVRMLYLFLGTQAHVLLATWLLLADFPVYATYELAPRVIPLSAYSDQQLAGGIMVLLAEPLVLGAISIIFVRWFAESERQDVAPTQGAMAGTPSLLPP